MLNPSENSKSSWPMSVKVLIVLGLLALVTGCVIYFVGHVTQARWQRYAEKLRAAGSPLTFDEIEELREIVPDDQNSALVINRLADRLKQMGGHRPEGDVFVFAGRKPKPSFFEGIPRDLIVPSREFLERHRDLFTELLTLRDKPGGRFDLKKDTGKGVLSMILPELTHVRAAAKLARLDGMLRLIDGDTAGAADAVHLQIAISATLNEHPSLIGRLVQVAVQALAVKTVEDTLRVGELDVATLNRLTTTLAGSLGRSPMKWALWGERAFFVGTCDELAAGKISPSQLMSIDGGGGEGVVLPFLPAMFVRHNQACGVEMYSWLVDAVDDPVALIQAAQRIEVEAPKLPVTQALVRVMLPSLIRAVILNVRLQAELRCAIAALAAERFRLKSGRLPTSLDELVPEFLGEVPVDPFDGKAMRFAIIDEGIVIYSVNENLIDDGGQVVRRKRKQRPHLLDVGFRLFRPEHRGLLLIDGPEDTED